MHYEMMRGLRHRPVVALCGCRLRAAGCGDA